MSAFHHEYAARLNSFRRSGESIDSLRAVAAVDGITAVEINFPEHIDLDTAEIVLAEARFIGLRVTALNLRYDPTRFIQGAFTNPDPGLRRSSIDITHAAAGLASRSGIPHVILWMGPDGFDYPFSCDYAATWRMMIDGFREVAAGQPGVRFSVEYKPSDPRRFSLIRTMGDSLLAVRDVALPNFGVTLDVCHALMAGENPATAAAIALDRGQLFGLHLNDGYGIADDGLMVGSVHLRQTLELLWELRIHGWNMPIYFDTFPVGTDPVDECAANIAQVEWCESVLDRIDIAAMQAARASANPTAVETVVHAALARG